MRRKQGDSIYMCTVTFEDGTTKSFSSETYDVEAVIAKLQATRKVVKVESIVTGTYK